ncbi:ATP-binding protein [Sphingomonas gilva]|uniref:ATP-binding protein n=1 Tax=Sphingomonas gilva TaxID=2305907 RepID=A0A396RLT4_9SPHN|nr:ATP-binding protein [Sphingomonas gilva]RHW17347.1 ATP-binding protein [Sphingomonas gilva]
MSVCVDMGVDGAGRPVPIDVEELLATRLLVQGNSGSGKSHLLRRLLEGSAGLVQQVIVDPEGDFVTLAEPFGHVVIEASDYSEREMGRFAQRIREHRASVVLSLEGLEAEAQMRCAAAFLSALFDAPREHWFPALVVVDEAQLFAPAAAGEVADDVRRASLSAMTNLMCRGRKRGLAGIIATQRLAKLAKNVAAEASNFLMGRTFLDIDMARAADLLGMERRQAEQIRDLQRGSFLALGPALSRRPVAIRIGAVKTSARSGNVALLPLPERPAETIRDTLLAPVEPAAAPPPPPPPTRIEPEELAARIETPAPAEAAPFDEDAFEAAAADAMRDLVADPEAAFRPAPALYQDFQMRCRMRGFVKPPVALADFARRLAMARAGIDPAERHDWGEALAAAGDLPDDMLGPFLLIARAAREGAETPGDAEIARVYGTHSQGRVRRLIANIEQRGLIASRIDLSGKRSFAVPSLGWTTAPSDPGEQALA